MRSRLETDGKYSAVRSKPAAQVDERLPPELGACLGDVGRRRPGSSIGSGSCTSGDRDPVSSSTSSRQLVDGVLDRTADVHRRGDRRVEQGEEPADLVVDVGERPGLAAVAVDRQRLAAQRLHDQVRHRPPVVGTHPRPEGVEDPHDAHVEVVVAVVRRGHRLGVALGLVVDAARADRVDVAPVRLGLRVHERVAVHLGGRGEEEGRPLGLGQPEPVVRAEAADLQDLDGDALEVDRRGGTGEVHDHVDGAGHPQVRADVVLDEGEPAPTEQLLDVGDRAGDEVVDRDDVVTAVEQRPAQV